MKTKIIPLIKKIIKLFMDLVTKKPNGILLFTLIINVDFGTKELAP